METTQSKSRWVLLVEDDELDAELITDRLKACKLNIEVEVAPSAEKGLLMIRARHYDLILCDFHLPGMNGLFFLRTIQKMRSNMRIILMTGYPNQELEAQVLHHGASTYLSKAVDDQTFITVIREALSFDRPAIPMTYH